MPLCLESELLGNIGIDTDRELGLVIKLLEVFFELALLLLSFFTSLAILLRVEDNFLELDNLVLAGDVIEEAVGLLCTANNTVATIR